MAKTFEVRGPFEVPVEIKKGGRHLVFKSFWDEEEQAEYATKRGCYVFAVRTSSLKPLYVGKATKTFKQEVFNQSNRVKCQNGFMDYKKGTPLLYLVVHPEGKGKTNATEISNIEDFLIQTGVARNPRIQNVRGRNEPKWKIKGVVRGDAGKPSNAASQFRKMFAIA